MEYRVNLGVWSRVFAVPSELVDRYIRTAGEAEIKVLLWALRHSDESYNDEMISAGTGVSIEKVPSAMDYWSGTGILQSMEPLQRNPQPAKGVMASQSAAVSQSKQEPQGTQASQDEDISEFAGKPDDEKPAADIRDSVSAAAAESTAKADKPAENQPQEKSGSRGMSDTESNAKKLEKALGRRMIRPDVDFINKRMSEDPNVLTLVREAEALLGKTISPTLSAVILSAYDDMNMPPEVIITLLSYCRSVGKMSIQYIEAVIDDWGNSGVDSMEAAEQKLQDIDRHSGAWKTVCRLFGIPFRQPSKKENDMCYSWIFEMGMSEELIKEAYERCINNTAKLQFSYINKILSTWHANNVSTLAEAIEFENRHRGSKSSVKTSSINYADLEDFDVFADMDKP